MFTLYLDLGEWEICADHGGTARAANRLVVPEQGQLPPAGRYRGQLTFEEGGSVEVAFALAERGGAAAGRDLLIEAGASPALGPGPASLVVSHVFPSSKPGEDDPGGAIRRGVQMMVSDKRARRAELLAELTEGMRCSG